GEFHALKVVDRKTFEHDRPFERELSGIQKFEPLSRAQTSQVGILHVGVNHTEGYFYYAMELADDAQADGAMGLAKAPPPASLEPAPALGTPAREDDVPAPDTTAAERWPAARPAFSSGPRALQSYTPHTLKLDLQVHRRLPVDRCIDIGLALTTALDHLHGHGLIHRDIKPSNVIFVNGVPKLAD